MASQADTTDTPLNGAQDGAPQVNALAQYIKDLSAENPSAPQVFQWQGTPQLDVQFNLNVSRVSDEIHEVILRIELKAASDQGAHFLVDLSYAGLFALINIPEEALRALPAGRGPAPAVPVRAPDRRRRGPEPRLPAGPARPDRLRRGLHGAARSRPGRRRRRAAQVDSEPVGNA